MAHAALIWHSPPTRWNSSPRRSEYSEAPFWSSPSLSVLDCTSCADRRPDHEGQSGAAAGERGGGRRAGRR
eukprot:7336524-Prymnesium_polylepis.1